MWAHSVNAFGRRHPLADHLRGTAALARSFAEPIGFGDLAWWAGLVHDGGKAWCEWQAKLLRVEATKGRVGLDHKSFGVHLARRHGLTPVEHVVAGHHGGLSNRAHVGDLLGGDTAEQSANAIRWGDAERVLRCEVPEIFTNVPDLPAEFGDDADPLVRDFAVRMLFSCLVDADVLDTQAHVLGVDSPRLAPALDASMLLERFLRRREVYLTERGKDRGSSPMDELRELVFHAALTAAMSEAPLARMTAPTGAAKTIAAAAYGLRHAAAFGKRRVIVAVPFVTITEQNAAVYRQLLDDDEDVTPTVLEHHSSVDLDPVERAGGRYDWRRLAAENWDAPFVVTTTVQLFESLFGCKPSRMRKVHRLANAVIVLDEVQALPHRLLPPIADALRVLTQRFGATVLLSSATQPELGALRPLHDLAAPEVVPDPADVFRRARRVKWKWRVKDRPTLTEIAAEALGYRQVLVVANTVRNTRTVFEYARDAADAEVLVVHLSTGMCPAHRRRVLAEVRQRLAADGSVFLASTSLIEAGVDLDFPVVFRAVAPPDSQAQAAGRCNRDGRLGAEGGLVVVFDPVDGGVPPSYRKQVETARRFVGDGPNQTDPEDIKTLRRYFPALYRALGVEGPNSPARSIEDARKKFDFVTVTDGPFEHGRGKRNREKAFRLINDDTVPIVVPYGDNDERDTVERAIAALTGPAPDRDDWRRLQPYVTMLRRDTAQKPDVAALTEPVVGDLLRWRGEYDDGFGLVLEPREEDFIL